MSYVKRRGRPPKNKPPPLQSDKSIVTAPAKKPSARKRFPCTLCTKDFDKKSRLSTHMKRIHDVEMSTNDEEQEPQKGCNGSADRQQYSCDVCGMLFTSQAVQEEHSKTHGRKKARIKCMECRKVFVKQRTLTTHMLKFHSLYKCCHCEEYFTQKTGLKTHQNACHSVKLTSKCGMKSKAEYIPPQVYSSKCQFCHKDMESDVGKVSHMTLYHHGLKCGKCEKWFQGQQGLLTHITICRTSPKDRLLKCHICLKHFDKVATLSSHVKPCYTEHHMNASKVRSLLSVNSDPSQRKKVESRCSVCGKTFAGRRALAGHMAHCLNQFRCSICEKTFMSEPVLEKHICIFHTGEKPYQCPECPKRFSHSNILKVHVETLHRLNSIAAGVKTVKKKMHKCLVCRRAFTQNSFLKMHMKIHTNEKRFKCGICGEKFSHEKATLEHIDVFHILNEERDNPENHEYIVECVDGEGWDDYPLSSPVSQGRSFLLSSNNLIMPRSREFTKASELGSNSRQYPKHLSLPSGHGSPGNPGEQGDVNPMQNVSRVGADNAAENEYSTSDTLAATLPMNQSPSVSLSDFSVNVTGHPSTRNTGYLHNQIPQVINAVVISEPSQGESADLPDHMQFIEDICQSDLVNTKESELSTTSSTTASSHFAQSVQYKPQDMHHCVEQSHNTSNGSIELELDDEEYYVTINHHSDSDSEEEEEDLDMESIVKNSQDYYSTSRCVQEEKSAGFTANKMSLQDFPSLPMQSQPSEQTALKSSEDLIRQNDNSFQELGCSEGTETRENKKHMMQKIPSEGVPRDSSKTCCSRPMCKCSSVGGSVQYFCGICQQGFLSPQDLHQHKVSTHSLRCNQCGQEYSRMIDLVTHYESCTSHNQVCASQTT